MKKFFLLFFIIQSALSIEVILECKAGKSTCTNNVIKIEEKTATIKLADVSHSDRTALHIRTAKAYFLPTNLKDVFPALEALIVKNSSLKEIERSNFAGLNGLTTLDLSVNFLTTLEDYTFEDLKDLEKINLDENQIEALPTHIFEKNTKLTQIQISRNKISMLKDVYFQTLPELKYLYLSHNLIGEFHSNTFQNCKKLTIFDFSNNKLMGTPKDIFEGLKSLKIKEKYFENNACIKAYEGKTKKVTDKESLEKAFDESCRPSNQWKIDELNGKIKNCEKDKNEKIEEIKKLEKDLKTANKTIEDNKETLETCQSDLTEKETAETKFESEKSMLKDEIKELKKKIDELKESKSQSDKFKTKVDEMNLELTALKSENVALDKTNKNIQTSFIKFGADNGNLTEEVKKLRENNEKIQEELTAMTEKFKTAEIDKINTENELKSYKDQNFVSDKEILETFKSIKTKNLNNNQPTAANTQIQPSTADPFDISCKFEKLEVKDRPTYYTCTVDGFINLNCNTKFNKMLGSHQFGSFDFSVESFNIQDSTLTDFPLEIYSQFRNLKMLKIQTSIFGIFNFKCGKIEYLNVLKSNIGEEFKISDCSTLKKLTIDNSNLKAITTTQKLPTLEEFIVKNNKLEEISAEFFKNFENLVTVDLSKNKINEIGGNIFDFNPKLKTVVFTDNQLAKVDGKIFTKNPILNMVIFKNCGCVNIIGLETSRIKVNDAKKTIDEGC